MLRITPQQSAATELTLILEGRLAGPWVALLQQSWEEWGTQPLTVDLADISFADQAGLQLLRQLQAAAVTLRNCPPFVKTQLNQPAQTQS